MSTEANSGDAEELLNEFDKHDDIDEMVEEVEEDTHMSQPLVSS